MFLSISLVNYFLEWTPLMRYCWQIPDDSILHDSKCVINVAIPGRGCTVKVEMMVDVYCILIDSF